MPLCAGTHLSANWLKKSRMHCANRTQKQVGTRRAMQATLAALQQALRLRACQCLLAASSPASLHCCRQKACSPARLLRGSRPRASLTHAVHTSSCGRSPCVRNSSATCEGMAGLAGLLGPRAGRHERAFAAARQAVVAWQRPLKSRAIAPKAACLGLPAWATAWPTGMHVRCTGKR